MSYKSNNRAWRSEEILRRQPVKLHWKITKLKVMRRMFCARLKCSTKYIYGIAALQRITRSDTAKTFPSVWHFSHAAKVFVSFIYAYANGKCCKKPQINYARVEYSRGFWHENEWHFNANNLKTISKTAWFAFCSFKKFVGISACIGRRVWLVERQVVSHTWSLLKYDI